MSSRASDSSGTVFQEQDQGTVVQNLPLSHLSVEVGHFYMKELENRSDEAIKAQFEQVKPWLDAARATAIHGAEQPRVSTCFLIDDYFHTFHDASRILHKLLRAADDARVPIDYIARESACARSSLDQFPIAELVARRILEEPAPEESTGGRPPTSSTGWLANGKPAREAAVLRAMQAHRWDPAVEFGKINHSIFLDVELWRDDAPPGSDEEEILANREYSCPFLAAVWQLVRLGLLRRDGAAALTVTDWSDGRLKGETADEWYELPDIIKVNKHAKPFYAYRSLSIMPQNFLPIEHAVRTIIGHVLIDEPVVEALNAQAREKGILLPSVIADRVNHHFLQREVM